MESPETPAHKFPFRAFQRAMFGTPAADASNLANEYDKSLILERRSSHHEQRHGNYTSDMPAAAKNNKDDAGICEETRAVKSETPNASPTKSILATPGTTSNRRKTVSFGDGVVVNEQKQGDAVEYAKPPSKPKDSPGVQSSSGSSDGKDRKPNKLMQEFLDAREESRSASSRVKGDESTGEKRMAPKAFEEKPGDETVNFDEPQSTSGKYFKAEFESYRINTNKEIRKLIHYRRAAKLYAKKKDIEALRLTEKTQEDEARVAEMEKRVSQFASKMLHEEPEADKEQLVQELAKQTALALQYKHQVQSMRKKLERHGIVVNDTDFSDSRAGIQETGNAQERAHERPHEINQKLDRAKTKVDEMKREQSEIDRLQDIVESSEKKVSTLEKDNNALKQTITRYKQEMTKYEDRRKEKEARLKHREARLEARFLDCRERLKRTSHQHREAEDALRESFSEERRHLQETIDELRMRISGILEHFPRSRPALNELSRSPP